MQAKGKSKKSGVASLKLLKKAIFLKKNGKQKSQNHRWSKRAKAYSGSLHACHSDDTSGHFGITKTCKMLTGRVYWRGIQFSIH